MNRRVVAATLYVIIPCAIYGALNLVTAVLYPEQLGSPTYYLVSAAFLVVFGLILYKKRGVLSGREEAVEDGKDLDRLMESRAERTVVFAVVAAVSLVLGVIVWLPLFTLDEFTVDMYFDPGLLAWLVVAYLFVMAGFLVIDRWLTDK